MNQRVYVQYMYRCVIFTGSLALLTGAIIAALVANVGAINPNCDTFCVARGSLFGFIFGSIGYCVMLICCSLAMKHLFGREIVFNGR